MSNTYYYFAATLPLIAFDGKLPFSTEEFLSSAQRLLRSEDYKLLDALLTESEIVTNNQTIGRWIEFNRQFRNSLSYYRSTKANKDPGQYIRGEFYPDSHTQQIIQETEKASDPLEAEKILAKEFWQFLDDLASGHYSDLEVIITYGLKLKILERFQLIQSPKGKEIYEELKKIDFPEGIGSSTL